MGRCCVINCSSNTQKNKKFSLFTLPKNPIILKEWINILSKVNGKDILLTSRVCELHFNLCVS
ncbi:arginine/serine-rich coiled-coil protein 2-like [Aphis craccivora]|uniref:Arginine/serine-rich coiled-coil protein 2-like n=1 Tax=Aphis craccivora TaxID=307492 RepID=A0A6G0YT90_APHCR|nr:arginine/serine-rich coiled-coil protein 2-like [Aphis craccivora]